MNTRAVVFAVYRPSGAPVFIVAYTGGSFRRLA
jgi:hypothetical protein